MKKLNETLWILFHPSFWMQNHRTCLVWEEWISEAVDRNCTIEILSPACAKIDGVPIWIANYPYAFGKLYFGGEFLPKRLTRKRLYDRIIRTQIKHLKQKG